MISNDVKHVGFNFLQKDGTYSQDFISEDKNFKVYDKGKIQIDLDQAVKVELSFEASTLKDLYTDGLAVGDDFVILSNDQWFVFSKQLHQSGFYNDKTPEQKEKIEEVLAKITSPIDGLLMNGYGHSINSRTQVITDYLRNEPTSLEASLALEASTRALKHFSNELLEGASKEKFDKLIDIYHARHEKRLENYKSTLEKFYEGVYIAKQNPNSALNYQPETKNKSYEDQVLLAKFRLKFDKPQSRAMIFRNLFKEFVNSSKFFKGLQESINTIYNKDTPNKDLESAMYNETRDTVEHIESYYNELNDLINEIKVN